MTEFLCPTNPKHELAMIDLDDHFRVLKCKSCNIKIYVPLIYTQKAKNELGGIIIDKYETPEDIQLDVDEEEAETLMCSEVNKLY